MEFACKSLFNDSYLSYETIIQKIANTVANNEEVMCKYGFHSIEDIACNYDHFLQYALCAMATVEDEVSATEKEVITELTDFYDMLCSRIPRYRRFIRTLSKQSFAEGAKDFFAPVIGKPKWAEYLSDADKEALVVIIDNTIAILNYFIEICKIDNKDGKDIPGKKRVLKRITTPLRMEFSVERKAKVEEAAPEGTGKKEIHSITESMSCLIGLSNVKKTLESFEKYALMKKRAEAQGLRIPSANLHMLFLGNPGTGKTTVARMMAKFLYECGIIQDEKVVECSRKDLVANYVGQTATKTDEKIQEAMGGILFVDEAYTLYSESGTDFGYEAVETIMKAMEDNKDRLIVIFAGYERDMEKFLSMNDGIRSRIGYTFIFDDYTADELVEMFIKKVQSDGFVVDEGCPEKLKKIFSYYRTQPKFGNGRFVDKVTHQTFMRKAERNQSPLHLIQEEDIPDQII